MRAGTSLLPKWDPSQHAANLGRGPLPSPACWDASGRQLASNGPKPETLALEISDHGGEVSGPLVSLGLPDGRGLGCPILAIAQVLRATPKPHPAALGFRQCSLGAGADPLRFALRDH